MTQFQCGTARRSARFAAAGGTINLKDMIMNSIAKLGLAVVFAISSASAVISQETGSIAPTFDTLITTMDTAATIDLAAVTDATTVNFVTVSSLQDADPAALDTKLQEMSADMTTLHASIEANAALKSKIEAAGYTVDKVISVEAAADGSYNFFVDDRA
jgi:hypothetical protein